MRIALVIERFLPRSGGVEGVAWTVAHELARDDEVLVVAREADPSARVEVRRVDVARGWQPRRVLRFARAAARAAPRGAFDVVYSLARTAEQHVYRAGAGSHAGYMARRYGRARRLHAASPRHAALLALERRVFADSAQLVLCNSAMVRRELQQRYRVPDGRLAVLHNGVDASRFALDPARRDRERRRLRDALGAAGDARVALFVGSGFARKGLDTALRALAAAGGDTRLWVAGGDRPNAWRRMARELGVERRVRFLGYRSDLPALYAAADAFLLPTRYDACSNASLEAAAAGLAVLTSASNGAAEVLDGGAAVVDDPEDAAAFARALGALADADAAARMSDAARAAAAKLSWSDHVAQLRALFAGVRR